MSKRERPEVKSKDRLYLPYVDREQSIVDSIREAMSLITPDDLKDVKCKMCGAPIAAIYAQAADDDGRIYWVRHELLLDKDLPQHVAYYRVSVEYLNKADIEELQLSGVEVDERGVAWAPNSRVAVDFDKVSNGDRLKHYKKIITLENPLTDPEVANNLSGLETFIADEVKVVSQIKKSIQKYHVLPPSEQTQ